MVPQNRKYAILEYSLITSSLISEVLQDNKESCRRSLSGVDRAIVSWNGRKPASLGDVVEYSQSEMINIVTDEDGDWYSDPDVIEGAP